MEEKIFEPVESVITIGFKKNKAKPVFRYKDCPVLRYMKAQNVLEIDFDGVGLHFDDVKKDYTGIQIVKVKYKSVIGKPKFICELED